MIKGSFAVILIGVLLTLSAGTFPIFKYKQYHARKEMKRRIKNAIPEDQLHVHKFVSPETDVDWVRKNKEFRLEDQMFDVVRTEYAGDTTVYFCVNDTEETILFADLDEHIQNELFSGRGGSRKKKRSSFKRAQIQLFYTDFNFKLETVFETKTQNITPYFYALKKANLEVPSPPPLT